MPGSFVARSTTWMSAVVVVVFSFLPAFAQNARASAPNNSSAADLLNKPADFVYLSPADIITLDLNRMSWSQDIRMASNLYEGLYRLDPKTLDCIPGVADQIDANPDKIHFTFHIRSAAKWSNGDPVTSNDFVFAWRRMLEEPAEYTYLLHYIKGAEDYENAFQKDNNGCDFTTVGVEAPDASTLKVTLAHPLTFFPDLCAFVPFYPLNEKSMQPFKRTDAKTGRVSYDEKFTLPGNLVTDGAYQLIAWTLKVGMRVEANPQYWDAVNVKCKSVVMTIAEEPLTGWRKFDNGEVDFIGDPDPSIAAALMDQKSPLIHTHNTNGTYFFSFNCMDKLADGSKNPLADVRVRQALSMVIDKRPIVEKLTRCGEPTTADYIPPGIFPGYDSPAGLPFDIEAGRKLLTEAGYPGGKGFPHISVLFNNEGTHRIISEYLTRVWKDQLNIDIEMEGVEIAEFRERLHKRKYAIARASWYGDYNDISTFADKYRSTADDNDSAWVNKEYDELCEKAAVEPDVPKRTAMLQRAETILLDEAPILPLYTYTNRWIYHDNVKGLYMNTRSHIDFAPIETGRSY